MSAPYVQTFTPVIGSLCCNARCPYCCSAMTCRYGLTNSEPDYDWDSFDIAAQIARERQCITAFITSKGEPILFPDTVEETIVRLKQTHKFPLIELQTNGIRLLYLSGEGVLRRWYKYGLKTMCISAVHWELERNREIYGSNYPDLKDVVRVCTEAGIRVRVSCVMLNGYVDSPDTVKQMRMKCTEWGADQLTIRPVSAPSKCLNWGEEWRLDWIKENQPSEDGQRRIYQWLESSNGEKRNLAHGAKVYSVQLQMREPEVNICLSNCFTPPTKDEEIRQIIWLPNGRITDNWDHEGFIIL